VENSTAGGWGTLFQLTQSSPSADTGRIRVFYKGDQVHSGVDNIGFFSATQLGAVEDAGDLLHTAERARLWLCVGHHEELRIRCAAHALAG
jgi:hypothetical protein